MYGRSSASTVRVVPFGLQSDSVLGRSSFADALASKGALPPLHPTATNQVPGIDLPPVAKTCARVTTSAFFTMNPP